MEVIGLLFIFSLLQIFFHMQQHIDSNRMKNWKITNQGLKQARIKCNMNDPLKMIIFQICRRYLPCPSAGIFNLSMYLPHFTTSVLSDTPESYQNCPCNFINEEEKFILSSKCSVFSKLSLIENLEKVLTLPSDEELKWQMKIRLHKCKIISIDKFDSTHRYVQLWTFVRYCNAEK